SAPAALLAASSRPVLHLTAPPPTAIYTLSLHDALPILTSAPAPTKPCFSTIAPSSTTAPMPIRHASAMRHACTTALWPMVTSSRSEEHTSELQSRENLVCRLLLEKKKKA